MTKEQEILRAVGQFNSYEINASELFSVICKYRQVNLPKNEDTILLIACSLFDVTVEDVLSNKRDRKLVDARSFYSKYVYSLGTNTYIAIGKKLNRHHASIINNVKTITDIIHTDKVYFEKWSQFINQIEQVCTN